MKLKARKEIKDICSIKNALEQFPGYIEYIQKFLQRGEN